MAAKRKWWRVHNEISHKNGRVGDDVWKELGDSAKGFNQLFDSCHYAKVFGASKWYKIFLKRMVESCKTIGEWKAVIRLAEEGSPTWRKAINEIYRRTNNEGGKNVLYRWEELRSLLPQEHRFMLKVEKEIKRLRAEKRAAKKQQCA